MFSKYRLIELTFGYFNFNLEYSWFFELQFNRYKLLLFIQSFIHQILYFGVLVIIFALLIVDLFVHIDRIRYHGSWNLFPVVLEHFLWAVSKPDIPICFPCRFVEGPGEGDGWVFMIFCFNWLLFLI